VVVASLGAGLLVVAGAIALLRSPDAAPDESATDGAGNIIPALCRARGAPVDQARATFLDEAHAPLHVLADDVASRDRGAAADLLEAKQAVESRLEEETADPALLQRDLDALIAAASGALVAMDLEAETCP
jgi:hypothetical protein